MPLYEYECTKCRHRFEVIQKFSDPPRDKCPACKAPVRRLVSAPAIQFKGSGWYVTDYGRKPEKSDSSKGESKPSEAGSSKPSTEGGSPVKSGGKGGGKGGGKD